MIVDNTKLRVQTCYDCDICINRHSIVNGFGSVKPNGLMFIAEAPGYKEDRYGLPLIGKAGELFNQYLYDVGLNRDIVYTTNTIKCLPRNGRAPFPHELTNCLPVLRNEVKILNPKIVILMGSFATWSYYQNFNLRVANLRNIPLSVKGRVVLSIYHPSFILRNSKDTRLSDEYHKQFRNIARLYQLLVDPLLTLKY